MQSEASLMSHWPPVGRRRNVEEMLAVFCLVLNPRILARCREVRGTNLSCSTASRETGWVPFTTEYQRFLRHRTYLQHSHPPSFKAKSGNDGHKPNSVLPSICATLSKPKVVVHWCGHTASLLKPCFWLGLATIPTGSKGITPTIFYSMISLGLNMQGTA